MSNKSNLVNINDRPAEEQKAIRQAGGRAAARVRHNKKELRTRLETMLAQRVQRSPLCMDITRDYTFDGDDTYYDELCATILNGALEGNASCIKTVLGVLLGGADPDTDDE